MFVCCFLFNIYRGWTPLVLKDISEFIYSCEGVIQGDPISLFSYAVGSLPLIQSMKDVEGCTQVWYADDSSVCGKISQIKKWFSILLDKGPLYGYYPEPTKCFVIVDQSQVDHVKESLSGFGVQVVTSHRVLGGVIGSDIEKEMYIKEKVNSWVHHLDTLSDIALDQPQAAYSAYTLSFQTERNIGKQNEHTCTY